MATGMWFASVSGGVGMLCVARMYTGLGIGGLLAAGSAIVSECANDRRRDIAVALMVAGYPLGVALGGIVASAILVYTGRWQSIFEVGAMVTAAMILPVVRYVPESVAFLCARKPKRATETIRLPSEVAAVDTRSFLKINEF
jgi:MFS family permease